MQTQTTVESPRDAASGRGPARGEALVFSDIEGQTALQRAQELLTIAQQMRDEAYAQLLDYPETAQDAARTVQLAMHTVREIQDINRSPRRHDGSQLTQKIQTLTNAVNHTANAVHDHDGVGTSSVAKRTAYYVATQPARKRTPEPQAPRRPRRHRRERHDDDDDDNDRHTQRTNRHEPGERASPSTVRHMVDTVMQAQNAALGALGFRSPWVASLGASMQTGTAVASAGAAAIIRGDREDSDTAALATGRGVRNVMRDDLGLPGAVAQFFGRTTTVALQTGGRVGAGAVNAADDARDLAMDLTAGWGTLGRQLRPLIEQMQAYKQIFDTDRDGRAELHEIVARMRQFHITDIHDVDGSAGISLADVRHTWNLRGQAHSH